MAPGPGLYFDLEGSSEGIHYNVFADKKLDPIKFLLTNWTGEELLFPGRWDPR